MTTFKELKEQYDKLPLAIREPVEVRFTDYETVRMNARKFLAEPNPAPQRCLLAGHVLEAGEEIAACVICSQEGCVDCLDSHDCHDYQVQNS